MDSCADGDGDGDGAGCRTPMAIDTPSDDDTVSECTPLLVSWHNGAAPYTLSIDISGPAGFQTIAQWAAIADTHFIWAANASAGTSVLFALADSAGAV